MLRYFHRYFLFALMSLNVKLSTLFEMHMSLLGGFLANMSFLMECFFAFTNNRGRLLFMEDKYDILKHDNRFRYQLLDRMRQDCEYFLGYGNRNAKHLWAQNEVEQIECMKLLWNSFDSEDKPEWLTWNQIVDYEKAMVR